MRTIWAIARPQGVPCHKPYDSASFIGYTLEVILRPPAYRRFPPRSKLPPYWRYAALPLPSGTARNSFRQTRPFTYRLGD